MHIGLLKAELVPPSSSETEIPSAHILNVVTLTASRCDVELCVRTFRLEELTAVGSNVQTCHCS